jgi:uncharacterized membrane protein YphA (DoxX/SURF4 family)
MTSPARLPAPGPSDFLALASRFAVGGVLIAAGFGKVSAAPEEFAFVIEQYQMVGPDMALSLATFLPWAELTVGFALILGWLTRPFAAAAAAMFLAFTIALGATQARGIELPNCGCFGDGWHMPPGATMALDAFLLLCCLAAYARGRERLSLDNWADAGYTGAHAGK